MNKKVLYVLLIAFLAFFLVSQYSKDLLWDEASYLSNAKFFLGDGNYKEIHRPLLISILIAGVWSVTGKNLLAARLFMVIFALLAIYFFHKISKTYFEKPIPATVLFAFFPLLSYWSFRVYTDVISVSFIVLSFLFIRKDRNWLAGSMLAIAILIRYSRGLFGLAVLLAFLLNKKFKALSKFSSGLSITLAPWLLYNSLKHGNPIYRLLHYMKVVGKWSLGKSDPSYMLIYHLITLFNLLALFTIVGSFEFNKKEDGKIPIIYILVFLVGYMFLVNRKIPRYLISIIPFMCLLSWQGIKSLNLDKEKVVLVVLFFVILAIPTVKIGQRWTQNQRCWGPIPEATEFLKGEAGQGDTVVSNIWPFVGYYTNLKVYSPWTSLKSFKLNYSADYYVKRSWGNLKTNRSILKLKKKFTGSCSEIGVYEIR